MSRAGILSERLPARSPRYSQLSRTDNHFRNPKCAGGGIAAARAIFKNQVCSNSGWTRAQVSAVAKPPRLV